MGAFSDFIVSIALETMKEKSVGKIEKTQLENQLKDFLDRESVKNYQITKDEEIDLWGLREYICNEMIEDVNLRLFGNKTEREIARQKIMEKSKLYAKPNTKLSERRTIDIVLKSVDILSRFYRKRIDKQSRFLAVEIEEAIAEQGTKTKEEIVNAFSEIKSEINDTSILSADRAIKQMRSGHEYLVEQSLNDFIKTIGTQHVLYPEFGYRLSDKNKLISVPLTKEASIKYPEKFNITASEIQLGDSLVPALTESVFNKAYRYQLPISFNIESATKYLGNIQDPIQSEAEQMVGGKGIINPPEFPPAFVCNLSVGTDVAIPYLLLRTKKILDNGVVITTNEEQKNRHFDISLGLDFTSLKATFNIRPLPMTNIMALQYRLYLKRALLGQPITITALESGEVILHGPVGNFDANNLDFEIEILQNVVKLEEYNKITIPIPEEIRQKDRIQLQKASKIITEQYIGEWDNFDITLTLTEDNITRITEVAEPTLQLAYTFDYEFSVFGTTYHLPVRREIEYARIKNLERLKEKARALDVGDLLKIEFSPGKGSKGKYMDRLQQGEISKELLFVKNAEQ